MDDAMCPACGEPIDWCRGHGEIGDPGGRAILDAHDGDDHAGCHPAGCDQAPIRRRITHAADQEGVQVLLLDPPETFDQAIVLESLDAEMGEDAQGHFDYNVVGGWVGDATPAFLVARVEMER